MAAETGEKIGAGFDGFEQLEAVDRSTRAVRHAVFHADHDGRFGGALYDARSQDADDTAMPSIAIEHEQSFGGECGVVGQAVFDGFEHEGFGVAAFAIQALELCCQFLGTADDRAW